MIKLRTTVPTFVIALALAGCGGGTSTTNGSQTTTLTEAPQPSGPVRARGENEVHARVGRAGGTLELGNGARLEIPPGALAQDTEMTLSVGAAAREAWDTETKRALGPVIEIAPAVQSSGDPFVVSCPAAQIPQGWEPGDLALGHEEEVGDTHLGGATATRWQMWPAHVQASRFVAELPSLGGHRIQFGVSR
jgi:hypothetical protein